MPTSAPGSRARALPERRAAVRGFTLIELMIVVALVGLASSLVVLAIRDPAATRLEHEAARLAALLESARAESRASGVSVHWVPRPDPQAQAGDPDAAGRDFRFVGLPRALRMPSRWLDPATTAEVAGAAVLNLGPEPMIGAQRIVLRLADQRLDLATDGLGPFAVVGADGPGPARP